MSLDVDIKPVNLNYHRFYSKFLNFPQGENFPPGGRLPQLYPNFFFPPGEIFPRTGYQNTLSVLVGRLPKLMNEPCQLRPAKRVFSGGKINRAGGAKI